MSTFTAPKGGTYMIRVGSIEFVRFLFIGEVCDLGDGEDYSVCLLSFPVETDKCTCDSRD